MGVQYGSTSEYSMLHGSTVLLSIVPQMFHASICVIIKQCTLGKMIFPFEIIKIKDDHLWI